MLRSSTQEKGNASQPAKKNSDLIVSCFSNQNLIFSFYLCADLTVAFLNLKLFNKTSLHNACERGDDNELERILDENTIDIYYQNQVIYILLCFAFLPQTIVLFKWGNTALHTAVRNQQYSCIDRLLRHRNVDRMRLMSICNKVK